MDSIPSFAEARVLVIGDIMLDRYWYGDTGRISPEAPVPVVRIGDEERRLGGAANVALNLAHVGASTTLIGVVGADEPAEAAQTLLHDAGIATDLVISPGHPTIAKLRVISRSQQLIRLDFEKSFALGGAFDRQALLERCRAALDAIDVVICSDYGKGTLADVSEIIGLAREAGKPVLVDPKGRDWQRYAGASLITPNAAEFEAYAGFQPADSEADVEASLARRAAETRQALDLGALLITRSEKGMNLFSAAGDLHLPTQAREVFDVTGAGDTVIAMVGAGLGAGLSLGEAAAVANLAAGVVVGKLGTASVSPAELQYAARAQRAAGRGVVDEDTLADWFSQAQARSERVVMTNGCFDLLHPGHIAYLEAARALGDWLVVAVNDDASVARLKGQGRPLNDLEHRMQVLRGLSAVDWVVPFAEDTPERLICRLLPDVLVKGGDYRVEDIAGGECVRAAGGEVRVLDFLAGYSTSAIVERMHADE
ncbi:bifunctional D-glycero-beta-D-manno-heptose-7-phosphate kinase/D-glycero-beta-D-manno-heptose 1-phosphate adenylyltransferase HldE [Salinisphaera sp. SPP-AMP-43]|uniref:bifunctional D-glycero-beta-D-manno-heptose-7-phosphate kinase/D-glycero-beta-D-manno-heptose 1-phosphate adenylyltransferase HldE n=1 Tax=Salinisphaera sp. SPP-AMP-43 TaxID=3121288 RepID=UPI003C6E2DA3